MFSQNLLHRIRLSFNSEGHHPELSALQIFKYIGPGLLITVGFIDPGNWAANMAAGSSYGYVLLWMVTLSTLMLIALQDNVSRLGIASGLCLSEAASLHAPKRVSRFVLITAMLASVSTSLAEILGGAIALQMLFQIPIRIGACLIVLLITVMLFTNSYRRIERWIIGFVSLIGLSFIYELSRTQIHWSQAIVGWALPVIPNGSMLIVMSVLGAVVMPHNLFLHSEIIQSRKWDLDNDKLIKKQLQFQFFDTFFSMLIGWAINSAMILLAAATFFHHNIVVTELPQAEAMLRPLLGSAAAVIFALALLFAGIASCVTSGMAGGSIFAGIWNEPYDINDSHSQWGVLISLLGALAVIMFITNTFQGLLVSQMLLSLQLPFTIFLQIWLTSNPRVMGKYVNSTRSKGLLIGIGVIVTLLNVLLLKSLVGL